MKNIPVSITGAVAILAVAALSCGSLQGAPIPGLFNTGVDDDGMSLGGSGVVDPHYTITSSPEEEVDFPGPDAVTLNPGFPVGPWLGEGDAARWIVPNAASGNGAEGDWTYETSFDLTGFDPTKATITGRWGVDNGGIDIVFNGESLGIANTTGFGALSEEWVIDTGFVAGVNTLEFIVNNAPATPNPTGLRVEMRGTVELADEAPTVLVQPESKNVFLGESVTFTTDADGTPPLSYQWSKDGKELGGETGTTLTIAKVKSKDGGDYTATITNATGSATTDIAKLSVVQPLTGLFNTGVGADGMLLEDFEVDPHYILVINPDAESTDAIVANTEGFPIGTGPWVASSDTSKWLSPRDDTNGAPGAYHYRFTFDITGFDPATIFVSGQWAVDDSAADILVNGVGTGPGGGGGFSTLGEFSVDDGFVAGENTLEFIVVNGGEADNPTGLRIEAIRGGGVALDVPTQIITQPSDALGFTGGEATLTVVATGVAPLSFQWRIEGENIEGAISEILTLTNLSAADEGEYDVVVTGGQGAVTSASAVVTVLSAIPGLHNTGVDDDGNLLEDFEVDSHYLLVENPDSESTDAIVATTEGFPIGDGPWVGPSDTSKWLSPREDTNGTFGDYVFRTQFDLAGFELETVFITGLWSVDNSGIDIELNGESLGLVNDTGFGGYTEFEIQEGFVAGVNTLAFIVNNAGDTDNPIGLRLENVVGGGRATDIGELRFTSIERTPEQVTLRWNGIAGRTYGIDFGTDLQDWTELDDSFIPDEDGAVYMDTDAARLAMPVLYYRVRQN